MGELRFEFGQSGAKHLSEGNWGQNIAQMRERIEELEQVITEKAEAREYIRGYPARQSGYQPV